MSCFITQLFPTRISCTWSVVDSGYSARPFLCEQAQHENLVTVVRVRSNRVFYQSPQVGESHKRRGHPQWYGERFDLKDETSWHSPDETTLTTLTTHRGKVLTAKITAGASNAESGD